MEEKRAKKSRFKYKSLKTEEEEQLKFENYTLTSEFLNPTSLEEKRAKKSPTPKLKADKIPKRATINI